MIGTVLDKQISRAACWYLSLFLLCLQAVPSPAAASFIPSSLPVKTDDQTGGMDALQADLEREWIAERLALAGLSPEEIGLKMGRLSDQECHEIASAMEQLQAGQGEEEIRDWWGFALAVFLIIRFPKEVAILAGICFLIWLEQYK